MSFRRKQKYQSLIIIINLLHSPHNHRNDLVQLSNITQIKTKQDREGSCAAVCKVHLSRGAQAAAAGSSLAHACAAVASSVTEQVLVRQV